MTLRRPKQTQAECEAAISPLRALTLWPEWAYAVCHLGKNIENRQWVPPRRREGLGATQRSQRCLESLTAKLRL